MVEREENHESNSDEVEEIVVATRRPIGEPFKNFSLWIVKGQKRFFKYKLPLAEDNAKSWFKSFRGGSILLTMILVITIPLMIDTGSWYNVFNTAMIFAIFAASWDLLAGVTGQVSFGHAAFFGLGGYGCGALFKFVGVPWYFSVILGGFIGVFFGLIVAIPSLRFKGPYLALGTLAFCLLLNGLFAIESLRFLFFGSLGIRNIPSITNYDYRAEFFIILIFMIVCIVILLVVFNSKLGTIFQAIRDDETSTKAAGINTWNYKLVAFMISAFFAGIAGSLYALHSGSVRPQIFSSLNSFFPIIMASIGGIATISGSVFGAYFYFVLNDILIRLFVSVLPVSLKLIFPNVATLIFALIFLLVVRFTERGLMEPIIKRSKSLGDLLMGK